MGALSKLCGDNNIRPEDMDQGFVIGQSFNFEEKTFQFTISTPRLLNFAEKAKCIHADATYKLRNTLRNRLSIGEFFTVMKSIVAGWSADRNPNSAGPKVFQTEAKMELTLMTEAYNWASDKRRPPIRSKRSTPTTINYFVPASGTKPFQKDEIEKYVQARSRISWKKFDTYRKCITRMWQVEFNDSNWKNSVCSCPIFPKQKISKHIIGIAIICKQFSVPDEAKTVPLGEKRKRGRPGKAGKALIVY